MTKKRPTPAMSKEDMRWRAEEDARAMMRAEEVKMDKARLKRAQKECNRLMQEAQKAVNTAKKVQKRG